MRTYFKVLWGIFSRVLHLAPWVTFFTYYSGGKVFDRQPHPGLKPLQLRVTEYIAFFCWLEELKDKIENMSSSSKLLDISKSGFVFSRPIKWIFPWELTGKTREQKKKEKAALVFCIVCTKRRFVCQSHLAIKRLLLSNQSHMVRLGNKRTWDMHTILDYTPLINLFWLVICSLEYMRKHI